MSNSAKRETIPESLFSVDDEEQTGKQLKIPLAPSSEPSPEFDALIKEQEAKRDRKSKRAKTMAASQFNRARAEVSEMMSTGEWTGCGARHLVALYDMMHTKCYGVEAAELGAGERYNAAMMAGNLVKRFFDGDYVEAVEFMRWAWQKEIETEKWRRERGRDGRRIGYRLMFGGNLVTDYKLSLARRGKRS